MDRHHIHWIYKSATETSIYEHMMDNSLVGPILEDSFRLHMGNMNCRSWLGVGVGEMSITEAYARRF